MKVNVYLCVLDLVVGDYWMRCVMFGKEVSPFTTHSRVLFYYSFNRYVCYEWNILFYLFVLIIFCFRFYCCYNRFINYYFVTFTLFRLLLSHHCCALNPYYCVVPILFLLMF